MIIHIDMDAFYAAVEIRDNPELKQRPVVVGGSPKGRGVVAAASYEARKYGIHSAMPVSRALQLCPDATILRPRMEHYAQIAKQIREIFHQFTSLVEPLSLDEAFLDVSGCERLFGDAQGIALKIKNRILSQLGLVASAGIAPNKYLAKIASDLEKPDGLVFVGQQDIVDFLSPLPVKKIWGVGEKCQARLHSIGIKTIGQLRNLNQEQLQPHFGVNAVHFWNLCRGIDPRKVVPDRVAKSISNETTFPTDIRERDILTARLIQLAWQVGRRLRRHQLAGKTVQLKIRFSDFRTISRSTTLEEPARSNQQIIDSAIRMIEKELLPRHEPVRLIGVGMNRLSTQAEHQRLLFDQDQQDRQQQLDSVTDNIAGKFGLRAIQSARVLQSPPERNDINRTPPGPEDPTDLPPP